MSDTLAAITEQIAKTQAAPHWRRIGIHHHHGICLPLFSLHTKQSAGIGEFLDLIPLISFCRDVGLDIIQLLPLNDTGKQTSPYSALSSLALNPIHLSLHALPDVERLYRYSEKIGFLKTFNEKPRVDYEPVFTLKKIFLRDYFSMCFEEVKNSQSYQNFLSDNPWLENYSLFKAIKIHQEWRSWEVWPLHLRSPSQSHLSDLMETYRTESDFHTFLQFLSFQQMAQVKQKAEESGIFIKGDIPILISRDSADVWGCRHNFLLNLAAGAPPDQYAKEGQYWGFPLYDWEGIEKERWHFWQQRLQVAEHFYHLYRLDHVVGFFRIWAIPLGKKPMEGRFIPEKEEEWLRLGKCIIQHLLDRSLMLPIAEDLGTVPPLVRTCLTELGVPGTKVMRWERKWHGDLSYIDPKKYQPLSMTCVSTHDSDTLALWWRHAPKEAKLLAETKNWQYTPFLDPNKTESLLYDSHHSSSLFHINLLNEYLSLIPDLVSVNMLDERINIPGEVLPSNWSYRFRPSVEELLNHEDLKKKIQSIIN